MGQKAEPPSGPARDRVPFRLALVGEATKPHVDLLRRSGYEVAYAADGSEAATLFEVGAEIDLIVLDFTLEKRPPEAILLLARRERDTETMMIALVPAPDATGFRRAFLAGARDVLASPARPEDVLAAVEQVLEPRLWTAVVDALRDEFGLSDVDQGVALGRDDMWTRLLTLREELARLAIYRQASEDKSPRDGPDGTAPPQQHVRLLSELEQAHRRADASSREADDLRALVDDLRRRVRQAEDGEATEAFDRVEPTAEWAPPEVQKRIAALDAAERAALEEERKAFAAMRERLEALEANVDDDVEQSRVRRGEVHAARAEVRAHEARVKRLEAKLSEREARILRLEAAQGESGAILLELALAEAEELRSQVRTLEERNRRLTTERDRARTRLFELEATLEATEARAAQVAMLQAELDATREKLGRARVNERDARAASTLRAELLGLQEALIVAEEDRASLSQSLERLRDALVEAEEHRDKSLAMLVATETELLSEREKLGALIEEHTEDHLSTLPIRTEDAEDT